MPHMTIEYSANTENIVDIQKMCARCRESMVGTGIFPRAGIRVRAIKCSHYAIADGSEGNYFIDFQIRIGQGRDVKSRKRAITSIFEDVTSFLEPQIQTYPLAVSMEMREIDSDFSLKRNGIRDKIGD